MEICEFTTEVDIKGVKELDFILAMVDRAITLWPNEYKSFVLRDCTNELPKSLFLMACVTFEKMISSGRTITGLGILNIVRPCWLSTMFTDRNSRYESELGPCGSCTLKLPYELKFRVIGFWLPEYVTLKINEYLVESHSVSH